jgi:hypothetical protein
MIDRVKRDPISNLQLSFRLPEFARATRPEDEESDTLWDRVIRMCDQYGLKPRERNAVHAYRDFDAPHLFTGQTGISCASGETHFRIVTPDGNAHWFEISK